MFIYMQLEMKPSTSKLGKRRRNSGRLIGGKCQILISPHPVENSSRMGFIVSSLHKHDLISVVEYSSFFFSDYTIVFYRYVLSLLI